MHKHEINTDSNGMVQQPLLCDWINRYGSKAKFTNEKYEQNMK